jgi:hypothetical protein
MKKLAVIRTNTETKCPFGLPIPFGCKHAGNAIERMAPLKVLGNDASEEESKKLIDANVKLLAYTLMSSNYEVTACPYASSVFEKKEAVECNFEDSAPGESASAGLLAAPFYSQIFSGIGLNGLYSYPIGYYADYNISRNLYYGVFSLQGSSRFEPGFRVTSQKAANKNE